MTLRLMLIQRGLEPEQNLYGLIGREPGELAHFLGVFSEADVVQYGINGARSVEGDPFQQWRWQKGGTR